MFNDYGIGISEMNHSKVIRDRKEKLNMLFYKLPVLHVKQYSVIKEGCELVKNIYYNF